MTENSPEKGVAALLQALRQKPTEADCQLCLSQLHDYVVAQLAGQDYRQQFAWTAVHLDTCTACAEAYALIYEAALAEAQNRLPQPAHLPDPDLSFLQSASWLAALQAALELHAARLTLQLNETLNALLAPQPTLAATRTLDDGRYTPRLLELTFDQAAAANVPFTLAAYADRQQPDRCLVEITVQPPGQSWPDLSGRAVTLHAAAQRAAAHTVTAATDDWGTAVFPDIPRSALTALRIEIEL
ncbi:MAG: hypothetical protein H6659_08095 [Ardenticatenaceae bacterium]|nr:hypothetical protein [Ardenticatenaceae bacterium]